MTYINETKPKVEKFVKESNNANRAFDQSLWNTVKVTIPSDQQEQAEKEAREEIKA